MNPPQSVVLVGLLLVQTPSQYPPTLPTQTLKNKTKRTDGGEKKKNEPRKPSSG
jgi:hypothetical protein